MKSKNTGYRLGLNELEALAGDVHNLTLEYFKILEILYNSRKELKTEEIAKKLVLYGDQEELPPRRRLQDKLQKLAKIGAVNRVEVGAGYKYELTEYFDNSSTKYGQEDLYTFEQWKSILDTYDYVPFIEDMQIILNRDARKVDEISLDFPVIDLPKISYKGKEYIEHFYKAIAETTKIDFVHQGFNKPKNKVVDFMPYLLKEHNKRWYVVGKREKEGEFYIYALDRIKSAVYDFDKELFEREEFDAQSHFSSSMGIFTSWNKSDLKYGPKEKDSKDPIEISFKVKDGDKFDNISYLTTTKIHHTQKESKVDDYGWMKITLNMFPEADLIRVLRGIGVRNLKDLKPIFLKKWVEEL